MNNENFNIAPNDENEEFTVEFGEIFNDGGTHDYNELDNKPKINGNTLEGNKTNEQLGIPVYTEGTGIKLSGNTISADTDVLATKADLNSKQNVIVDLPQIRSGAEAGATAVQPEDLARIATTGSYNDSLDKPSINNVTLTGNKTLGALGIQPKGDYALESEIPDVSNFITKDVNNLTYYTLSSELSSVATSGSYNDLTNKPKINNVELVGNKSLNDLGIVTLDEFYKAFPTDTSSGVVASFTDGADNLPLKSLVVNINPVQDLSQGDPSPENVCPISGWTGAQVVRTGKNLLPMEIQSGSYSYGTTITVNPDLSITYNKPNGNGWTASALGTFWLPAGTYTIIEDGDSSTNGRISLKKLPSNIEIVNTRWNKRLTFTLTEATQIYADFSRAAQATDVIIKFMIFKGDTATASDYEPYAGRQVQVSWQTEAGTVYGGKLDVLTGKLTVDMAMPSLDEGTIYRDNDTYKIWMVKNLPRSVSVSGGRAISNITKTFGNVSSTALETRIQLPSGTQQILFASIPTGFNIADVQVAYELATPIEIQLDTHEINTLLGVNNIWADTGGTEVEYRADTKLYINKMIGDAETISTRLASSGRETALYKGAINPIETNIPLEEEGVEYEKN